MLRKYFIYYSIFTSNKKRIRNAFQHFLVSKTFFCNYLFFRIIIFRIVYRIKINHSTVRKIRRCLTVVILCGLLCHYVIVLRGLKPAQYKNKLAINQILDA